MFAVLWRRRALDRLAEIWMSASDRDAVTNAVSQVDRTLSHDPECQGESRP
jgi:hypothetical protein